MANIKSINGNPIVLGAEGIEDDSIPDGKLAQSGGVLSEVHDISRQIDLINTGEGIMTEYNSVVKYSELHARTSAMNIYFDEDGFHMSYHYDNDSYASQYAAGASLSNLHIDSESIPLYALKVPNGDDCIITFEASNVSVDDDGTGRNVRLVVYGYSNDYTMYKTYSYYFFGSTNGDVTIQVSEEVDLSSYPNVIVWGVSATKQTGSTHYDVVVKSIYLASQGKSGFNLSEKISNINERITNLETHTGGNDTQTLIKPDSDAYLYRKTIPSYYFAMPETPMSFTDDEYLTERMNTIPEGKHFIFITDTHWPSNAKNSTALMAYVRKRMGINDVIFGGDMLDRDYDKYLGKKHMAEYMNESLSAFGDNFIVVMGNHDNNTANSGNDSQEQVQASILPYSVVYDTSFKQVSKRAHMQDVSRLVGIISDSDDLADMEAYFKLHYYIDDDVQGIRYIVLNSGTTNNNGVVKTYFGVAYTRELYLQMDFLDNALRTVPEGYDVVVAIHVAVDWRINQLATQNLAIAEMLTGRKNRSTVTINNSNTSALIDSWYLRGQHTYNYAGLPKVGKVFIIGGDTHWDVNCVTGYENGEYVSKTYNDNWNLTNGDVLTVVSQCDAYLRDNYEASVPMTIGNTTEQCFEVVTITNTGVVLTRFGVGSSREYVAR